MNHVVLEVVKTDHANVMKLCFKLINVPTQDIPEGFDLPYVPLTLSNIINLDHTV